MDLYVLCLPPPGGFFCLTGYIELGRGVFGVRQPGETPAYVLHYSSFTPPSSGLNVYFVYHKKSSFQVPRNLKSLGNVRRLGAFFFIFASIDRELKSLHDCG